MAEQRDPPTTRLSWSRPPQPPVGQWMEADPLPVGRWTTQPPPVQLAPPVASNEPVVIAHAVTVILGALVTAGWVAVPSTTIDVVGTIVALALSTVGAVLARSQVTPGAGIWAQITGFVQDEIARLGPPQ